MIRKQVEVLPILKCEEKLWMGLDWIGEAEDATSLVEVKDAGSATGKVMLDFEVCGFHEPGTFKKQVATEEGTAQKR